MADAGIYDFLINATINSATLREIINNPRTAEDCDYIYEHDSAVSEMERRSSAYSNTASAFAQTKVMPNLYVFTSAKPGTGKSFASANTSIMIARYGSNKNGNPPRVLLVEGDLQTLSLGTLLGVNNPQYNIKKALQRIATIVDENGQVVGSQDQIDAVNSFIMDCCVRVPNVPNLRTICSSSFDISEREDVAAFDFYYLFDVVCSSFDVVIVDANSSIEHQSTGPVMQLANQLFIVVSDDSESVRVTKHFTEEIARLGFAGKISYVINRCQTESTLADNEFRPEYSARESFSVQQDIAAEIPMVDQAFAYNCIYEHKPMALDASDDSLLARIAFTQIADRIWHMGNFDALKKSVEKLEGTDDKKQKGRKR